VRFSARRTTVLPATANTRNGQPSQAGSARRSRSTMGYGGDDPHPPGGTPRALGPLLQAEDLCRKNRSQQLPTRPDEAVRALGPAEAARSKTRPNFGPSQRSMSSMSEKAAGTMTSVRPRGRDESADDGDRMGSAERLVAPESDRHRQHAGDHGYGRHDNGRARLCPASIIGGRRSLPARASLRWAKSTRRIEFLATMPISMRKPIMTPSETEWCVSASAATEPRRSIAAARTGW